MMGAAWIAPVKSDQPDSPLINLPDAPISRISYGVPNQRARRPRRNRRNRKKKSGLGSLPVDAQDLILSKLSFKELFRLKLVSKSFNDRIKRETGELRPQEAVLTALHFFAGEHGEWQCTGYDLMASSWMKLPPFRMLTRLDSLLFKDHSICVGSHGIMCANVSTSSSSHEKIMVFNPLTGRSEKLPPLNHRRNPVLMHMVMLNTEVPSSQKSDHYKIIVAGSARAGEEHLSKITEVYDSRTHVWTVTEELPGPRFGLNEHQSGIYKDGILYCIAFLEGEDCGKGVVAYDVDEGQWLPHLSCQLPNPTNLNIVQLVDCNGEVVLFSETETNPYTRNVDHRIDVLESVALGRGQWRTVMSVSKGGGQAGLQVYPEYACVPFGEGKVCVFNTIVHTGNVYDIQTGRWIEALAAPAVPTWPTTARGETSNMGFYTMNPLTFTFEPSFKGNPTL